MQSVKKQFDLCLQYFSLNCYLRYITLNIRKSNMVFLLNRQKFLCTRKSVIIS